VISAVPRCARIQSQKRGEQGRRLRHGLNGRGVDHANLLQMLKEQPNTNEQIKPMRMSVARTSASHQMLVEPPQNSLIWCVVGQTFDFGPIEEMFRRSDMSAGSDLGVATLI